MTTYVRQRLATDCGVAAVAMLAGVSYDDAMRALFAGVSARRKTFRTSYQDIRRAVAPASGYTVWFSASRRRWRSWAELDCKRGILRIAWTRASKSSATHWIVFDGTDVDGPPLFYDPLGLVMGKDDLPGAWRPVSFQTVRVPRSAAK